MMEKQQAFTLIELMVVIAVLAILVAIAVSAYRDYTIRSRISEAINAVGSAKIAVSETQSNQGVVPDQAATGFESFDSQYIDNIEILGDSTGTILVTTRDTGALPDPIIRFEPTFAAGAAVWACTAAGTVPATCRPHAETDKNAH